MTSLCYVVLCTNRNFYSIESIIRLVRVVLQNTTDTDETKFLETDTRLRLWVAFIRDRVRDRDSEYALYESETETETLESRETRD